MTNPPVTEPADAPDEAPPPPFDPAVVEGVLRQLDKTVKAHQLYEGDRNNPTYARSLEMARAAFTPLWAETDALVLQVSDLQFTWSGVPVHVQEGQTSDSLPWTLYKDGLRELTLTPGFEREEIEKFLAVIPRVRRATANDDDLLTILWEQEFQHLSYKYVELATEGAPIDSSAQPGKWPVMPGEVVEDPRMAVEAAQADASAEGKAGGSGAAEVKERPAGVVSMDDFDSTLYFLDDAEVRYLRQELNSEYGADLRKRTLDMLLDIYELQADALVRKEAVEKLDTLTIHLLSGGQFANVAYLIREAGVAAERAKELDQELRDRVKGLSDRLSDPKVLAELLGAMDDSPALPPAADLEQLFVQLRPTALGTIFAWIARSTNAKLKPLLEKAADRLAVSHTGEVVKLITSAEGAVAMEAVRRAGALKTPAAVVALGKLLNEPYRDLRIAAVGALVEIGTAGAMQALEKALEDLDRDVRVAAIKALSARTHKPALTRVGAIVKSKDIKDADRTERLALFELNGQLCGDSGVPYLDELLNGKGGLFARKEDPELRACAAVALGRIGTPKVQEALQKSAGEKDVVVRTAVSRALRGGRE
ncbi:MAG: HEAT repeat domain-containing protein [Gemmatimonadetes bacterium]|nr:HEAT repeat domain-containing protein [Gemmatimonadota bacterium]